MKKLLVLAALCATSLAASAQWTFLLDSDDARLLVKNGSLSTGINSNGVPWASAVFSVFTNGELREEMHAVVAVESCANGGGELLTYTPATKARKKYWWSANGNKLYDGVGLFICLAVEEKFKEGNSDKSKPQPKPTI